MTKPNYIISPCGTSLLTNVARDIEGFPIGMIFRWANEKTPDKIPDEYRQKLEQLLEFVQVQIDAADIKKAKKLSAELNSILCFYQDQLPPANRDTHLLLSTDTWLGEQTTQLVHNWLAKQGQYVKVHRQKDLQTQDLNAFQTALSDLVKTIDREVSGYAKSHHIVFNLTGGFKSVQGFLQSIANFYADETIYIFEGSSELLRIPRLPIQINAEPIIQKHLNYFRQLEIGESLDSPADIPETLLFHIDDEWTLSAWGEVIWQQSKKNIYKELQPSPSDRIRYSESFIKAVKRLNPDRIRMINERIDQLHRYLKKGDNPNSLGFQKLRGKKMLPSTHEIDAWSDLDAKRIYGHFEKEVFVIDKLDKGLH